VYSINNQKLTNFSSFPNSSWHRVDYKEVTVFFHTEQLPKKDNPSHRHCDLTSFAFYWKGQPILVDPGRFNYRIGDPLGDYGVFAKAHNCLTIDGFEPQAGINTRRLPDFYRTSNVKTKYHNNSEEFKFEIEHDGFCRLFGDSIIHTRILRLSKGCFLIEDRLDGRKIHQLDTYFHWNPQIKLTRINGDPNLFIVNIDNNHFEGTFRYNAIQKDDVLLQPDLTEATINANNTGWYFPKYGKKEKTTTLVFSEKVKLPFTNRYSLEWSV